MRIYTFMEPSTTEEIVYTLSQERGKFEASSKVRVWLLLLTGNDTISGGRGRAVIRAHEGFDTQARISASHDLLSIHDNQEF